MKIIVHKVRVFWIVAQRHRGEPRGEPRGVVIRWAVLLDRGCFMIYDEIWGWLSVPVDPWAGQVPWVDDGFRWLVR